MRGGAFCALSGGGELPKHEDLSRANRRPEAEIWHSRRDDACRATKARRRAWHHQRLDNRLALRSDGSR